MAKQVHNQIIHTVAKEILGQMGLTPLKANRTWVDDRGWYAILVGFTPRPSAMGTSLNVGIHFHWYAHDALSFDIGIPESDFISFYDEEGFRVEIQRIMHQARERVIHLRQEFSNFKSAQHFICNYPFAESNLWGTYHKGTVCGLADDGNNQAMYYDHVISSTNEQPWASELKMRTKDLRHLSSDITEFKKHIYQVIQNSRHQKKMKRYEDQHLWF